MFCPTRLFFLLESILNKINIEDMRTGLRRGCNTQLSPSNVSKASYLLHLHQLNCKNLEILPHSEIPVAQGLEVHSEPVEKVYITHNLETLATTSGSSNRRLLSSFSPFMYPSWPNHKASCSLDFVTIFVMIFFLVMMIHVSPKHSNWWKY